MKTDAQVQLDVIEELKWEPSVNAAQIGVEVKDGIVTLAGHVDSYAEKWGAERAAQRVAGVKALAIEMDVKLPGTSHRNDVDIARTAQNILSFATYLTDDCVKVSVEDGWITLSGKVDWDFQRQSVLDAVRHLMGVKGVSNDISIQPKASSSAVKSNIEAALKRRAKADSQKILVDVQGSEVTLSGQATTWAEHDLAVHSAWGTAGVHKVKDHMLVGY